MDSRPEMPLAVSLVLVTAAFAVIAGALPLALSLDAMPRDVATLQELGRPHHLIYWNLAVQVAAIALALVSFVIVLAKPPRIAARWGLALHATMLLAVFWRHGFAMQAMEEFPIRLAWLTIAGILLLPLRRFRDQWDPEPAPDAPGLRYRLPTVTKVLLALVVLATGMVVVFLGGWALASI